MDHWNPRRPDPRNPWPPEYWDQQPVDHWNKWSPEYGDRQPSEPCPTESWGQQPTYPRDPWSHKHRDPWSHEHWNPWSHKHLDPWSHKHRDQHPIDLKNSRSREYYQQTIHRPTRIRHSSVSHEPRFRHNSGQRDSTFHPYRHRDHRNSYHRRNSSTVATCSLLSKSSKDSAKKHCKNASAGNCSNLKVVSVNASTTTPASNKSSNTTSNAANKKASKKPKESLQVQVENNDAPEDVLYLYSVNPHEGKLVELVDLSENSQISENQDLLASESNNSYMPVNSNNEDSTCDDTNTLLNNEKNKRTPKIQGECRDAYCNMCNKSYEELHNNKCDLYIARCGHLFCVLCIPLLKIKGKCIKCKNVISNLRKICL